MNNNFNSRCPQLEINESIQVVDFAGRADSPLILHTKNNRVLTFGTREESFGHEIVRFQFIDKDRNDEWPQDTKEKSLFAYAIPGLIFTENGRYLFFVSAIGGTGIFNPSEGQFAIMYPLIVVDLVSERFAFVNDNFTPPFTAEKVLESAKQYTWQWHKGFQSDEIYTKFRELHPRVELEKLQPAPTEPSFLKRILKSLFSGD